MAEGAPLVKPSTISVLARIFSAGDAETQQKLLATVSTVDAMSGRVGLLANVLADRKLAQLSRVLHALVIATMHDDDPMALTGADVWALKYRSKKADMPWRSKQQTRQEAARAVRDTLDRMKKERRTRQQVARWLAHEVEGALSLYAKVQPMTVQNVTAMREQLAGDILAGMRAEKADGPDDVFDEDTELTIVAAFKAGGLRRQVADQLFKAAKPRAAR